MNSNSRVVVIGSGGHAQIVTSILMATGHQVIGFYDYDQQKWGSSIFGIPVIGPIAKILTAQDFSHGIIGIGHNETRKERDKPEINSASSLSHILLLNCNTFLA